MTKNSQEPSKQTPKRGRPPKAKPTKAKPSTPAKMYYAVLPVGREADFYVGEEEKDIRKDELDRLGIMYTIKEYCNVAWANRVVCEHNTKLHSANCKWERHLTDESESGSANANQNIQHTEDSKPP